MQNKKWIILIIFGLVLISFMSVVNNVSGAITFTQGTTPPHTITATGDYGSAFLKNVAFEENRTLSTLYSSPVLNVGSVGTSNTFTSPLRVTDRKGIYGSQLTCFLYAPVGFTSCVLTFPVTYFDGTTGNIALTYVGVGTQNVAATGVVIKDCRSVTITALVGTSFRIKVNQSFFGVMRNITGLTDRYYDPSPYWYNESFTEHDYYIENAVMVLGVATGGVGSNMTIENTRLTFIDNPYLYEGVSYNTLFNLKRNVRFSILNSTVETGFSGWPVYPQNFILFSNNLGTSRVRIDKSRLISRGNIFGSPFSGSIITSQSYNTNGVQYDINSTFFEGIGFSNCNLRNFKNNIICNFPSQVFYMCNMGDVSNIQVLHCRYGFAFFQFGFNLTTVNFDLYTSLGNILDPGAGADLNVHLIDCTSNTYRLTGSADIDISPYARQYIFWDKTVRIKTQNNSVNLSGVTVRFYNKTGVLKSTQTTNANGNIPTTTLSAFRWSYATGINPVYDAPYNITFSKTGYQNTWIKDYFNSPLNLTIPLKRNYTSGLVISDNSINCIGTIEYSFSPSTGLYGEWWVFVNKTGIGSVSGTEFSLDNPNPANGTLNTNYIFNNNTGLNVSVDISYNNFSKGKGYENVTTGDNNNISIYSNNLAGQSFIIGANSDNESFYITNISLKLFRKGLPGDCIIYIKNATYGLPTNIIAEYILDGNSLTTNNNGEWYNIQFTFSNDILKHNELVWGENEYSIILKCPTGDINNYIGWKYGTSWHLYSDLLISFNNGVTWINLIGKDFMFSVYGVNTNVINLTFSSNSSSTWKQFNKTFVVSNGTIFVFNPNMTLSDTKYYWRVIAESNNTILDNKTFNFETKCINYSDWLYIASLSLSPELFLLSLWIFFLYLWFKAESYEITALVAVILAPYSVLMSLYMIPVFITDATLLTIMQIFPIFIALIILGYTIEKYGSRKKK